MSFFFPAALTLGSFSSSATHGILSACLTPCRLPGRSLLGMSCARISRHASAVPRFPSILGPPSMLVIPLLFVHIQQLRPLYRVLLGSALLSCCSGLQQGLYLPPYISGRACRTVVFPRVCHFLVLSVQSPLSFSVGLPFNSLPNSNR